MISPTMLLSLMETNLNPMTLKANLIVTGLWVPILCDGVPFEELQLNFAENETATHYLCFRRSMKIEKAFKMLNNEVCASWITIKIMRDVRIKYVFSTVKNFQNIFPKKKKKVLHFTNNTVNNTNTTRITFYRVNHVLTPTFSKYPIFYFVFILWLPSILKLYFD